MLNVLILSINRRIDLFCRQKSKNTPLGHQNKAARNQIKAEIFLCLIKNLAMA